MQLCEFADASNASLQIPKVASSKVKRQMAREIATESIAVKD